MKVSYVIAAHNSCSVIGRTIDQVSEYFREAALDFEILVVENGSSDDTFSIVEMISTSNPNVRPLQSLKGLGHAFKTGILASEGDLVVATADDLPFGFSDLNQVLPLKDSLRVAIGSKAHRDSIIKRSIKRTIASTGLRLIRRLVLKLNVGDPQGTYLVNGPLARLIAARCSQPGYIFTTEFAYVAKQLGESITEVPIQLDAEVRPSTVRLVRDSFTMLLGMLEIRHMHKKKV